MELKRGKGDDFLQKNKFSWQVDSNMEKCDKHQVNFTNEAIEMHIQVIALVDWEFTFLGDSHSKRIHSAQL